MRLFVTVFSREVTKTQRFMAEKTYLMLGGNVGDRMDYLRRAVAAIQHHVGRVVAISGVYETEPWGFDDPCPFLNQVVAVETNLDPYALLKSTQQIEDALGRIRTQDGYQARTMDIDILLYGHQAIHTPDLVIPHPRMAERMFVLLPMAELAPDLEHPVLHHNMAYLKEHCRDTMQVSVFFNDFA